MKRSVMIGIFALLAAAIAWAGTRPNSVTAAQRVRVDARQPQVADSVQIKTVGRKPLSAYVVRDLFAERAPAPARPVPPTPAVPPVPIAPAPTPPDPLADYVYSGTVSMGGRRLALIENSKTREGSFVAVGDSFAGTTVARVTTDSVTVRVGGRSRTLSKPSDFKLTPLDKDAPYLAAGTASSPAPGAGQADAGQPGRRGPRGRGGPPPTPEASAAAAAASAAKAAEAAAQAAVKMEALQSMRAAESQVLELSVPAQSLEVLSEPVIIKD